MDQSKFRRSRNIEDRRSEVQPSGPFGTPGYPDNVFVTGDGTLVDLDANEMPEIKDTALGRDLGVNQLPDVPGSPKRNVGRDQKFGFKSNNDRDLMIRTILGEAADQGPHGQAAVAHVIMNRLNAGRWGATPTAVVLAPNQFEPWATRKAELMAIKPDSAAYRNVGDIVDMVQAGEIPDVTSGATHFLNEKIVRQRRGGSLPDWAAAPVAKIGGHTFYRPEGSAAPKKAAGDPLDAINRAIEAID